MVKTSLWFSIVYSFYYFFTLSFAALIGFLLKCIALKSLVNFGNLLNPVWILGLGLFFLSGLKQLWKPRNTNWVLGFGLSSQFSQICPWCKLQQHQKKKCGRRGVRRGSNAEGLNPSDGLLTNFKASLHKFKFIGTNKEGVILNPYKKFYTTMLAKI